MTDDKATHLRETRDAFRDRRGGGGLRAAAGEAGAHEEDAPMKATKGTTEELIGSHGGLGGPQTQPLIMHPADWELDEVLVGAPAVYRQIRRWAERHLDHRFGKDGSAALLPTPERAPAAEVSTAA